MAFNLKPGRDLHLVATADLPLGCVVAPGHPLAALSQVTFKDVAAWPLAAQSKVLAIRRYLERRHNWLLQEARPPLVTNSLQLVKSLVRSGSHVALTSELDAGPEILAGELCFLPLKDKSAQPQTVGVAVSAGRALPHIAPHGGRAPGRALDRLPGPCACGGRRYKPKETETAPRPEVATPWAP